MAWAILTRVAAIMSTLRKKTEVTFYDPKTATKELVDEVFEITRNRLKVIKIIALAKSAIRNNLGEELK
jgi:hypothetical protein